MDSFLLTSTQREIWFDQMLHPAVPLYHIGGYLRIEGKIEVEVFRQTLDSLFQENDAFRLRIVDQQGIPAQQLAAHHDVPFTFHDYSDQADAHQQAMTWMEQAFLQPFPIYDAPLIDFVLFKIREDLYYSFQKYHHLAVDGWAISLSVQRQGEIYTDLLTACGRDDYTQFPYSQFVENDRSYLESAKFLKDQAYWLGKYQNHIPAPLIPRPYVDLDGEVMGSQRHILFLKRAFYDRLDAFAQQHKTSTFHVILGALYCYFTRVGDRDDFIVGLPTLNRSKAEFKKTMGLFASLSPAWFRAGREIDFLQLLQEIGKVLQQDYRYQRFPLSELNRQLGLHKQHRRQLFDLTLSYEKHTYDTRFIDVPGFAVNMTNRFEQSALAIFIREFHAHEDVQVDFDFNLGAFRPADIERLTQRFEYVLQEVIEKPATPIKHLRLLPDAELQQVLHDFNATDAPTTLANAATLLSLFAQQVAAQPDKTALVFAGQPLSYAELEQQSTDLAFYLQAQGVSSGHVVGVFLERSVAMLVSVLAIFKAGAVYLPLDPAYPAARLGFMLEDATPLVVLTLSELEAKLPAHQGKVLALDADTDWLASKASVSLTPINPDQAAYLIYTSGSTGKPKGVLLHHAGLHNLAIAQIQAFEVQPTSRVLQFASPNFDASISEMAMALGSGASLYLAPQDDLLPGDNLTQLLNQYAITHVTLPPTALAVMSPDTCDLLSHLIVAGEVCAPELAARWAVGRRFFNAYGPTESTVCATIADCSTVQEQLPIGKPLSNMQVYVLDAYCIPAPIGVAGELYIGGIGLAVGYWQRPELTAEKFVERELDGKLQRLYKTGDLACWREDGQLDFLGRLDDQVKLRGFRIELGEIEAVLSTHPHLRACSLVVHTSPTAGQRLLAACVPLEGAVMPGVAEFREFLRQHLPEYMIPGLFVAFDALPLTPNGKVDRRQLAALPLEQQDTGQALVLPRNDKERLLARIWQDVLGIGAVGIEDSFFELGGDSITAIQVASRAVQAGLHLTPKLLFQHQTIAALASVATQGKQVLAEQGLVTGTVPLTAIQHWFIAQALAEPHHFNQAVMLKLSPDFQADHLPPIMAALLHHHDALRSRFNPFQGLWIAADAHVDAEIQANISHYDLSRAGADAPQQMERIANTLQASLNLEQGVWWKLAWFQLAAGQASRLLWVVHHLAVDGVSWRILLEDFVLAYQQLAAGQAIQLPAKTSAFQQWAQRIQDYALTDQVQAELAGWVQRLSVQLPSVPVDNLAPLATNTVANAQTFTLTLDSATTQALLSHVPPTYGMNLQEVLLTALAQVLTRWMGCEQVLLDVEQHGRESLFEDVDVSRTVGWFTSLFPLVLQLPTDAALPDQALKTIKEQIRRIPQHGLGYGLLRYLNPQGREQLDALPQAQILFNYLGQFQGVSNAPLLGLADESTGLMHGRANQRAHVLDINALIRDGQLVLSWGYNAQWHSADTIAQLAQAFKLALQALIAHCQQQTQSVYTPSDFPLTALSQRQLDAVVSGERLEDLYPVTPAQEGMLFHTLYAPESGIYMEQFSLLLEGDVQPTAFQTAWEQTVSRHASLRTAFIWAGLEQPLQRVQAQVCLPWVSQDWREWDAATQAAQLDAFLREDRRRGFALDTAPLMRCALLRLDEQHYQFVWTFHHLLMDGWCLPLIFNDVRLLYAGLKQQQAVTLPPVTPYRQYIAWLQQQDSTAAKRFWQQQLQGFTAPTDLRIGNSRKHGQTVEQCHEQVLQLPAQVTAALQKLVRSQRLTLNVVLQGAWATLLSRYSGTEDVVFGMTQAGRPAGLQGVEGMVGLFINTLPVRASVTPSKPLLAWLAELHQQQVDSESHVHTPLVHIQQWSDVADNVPLFDSLLVFENYPFDESLGASRLDDLHIRAVNVVEHTNYPLTLLASLSADCLQLRALYDAERFEFASIQRLLGHLGTLLASMADRPEQQVLGNLKLLTAPEQQQLQAWNATELALPPVTSFITLFEQQVQAQPQRMAVRYADQHLTYAELNQRSNQLARHLRTLGVGRDTLVGLCVERSLEMLVGLLAILKAGGAYLPLDPAYPAQRLAFVVRDAGVETILTDSSLTGVLSGNVERLVCLDQIQNHLSAYPVDNLAHEGSADDLAYVIYTSGSTGNPKGVQISHAALLNFLLAMQLSPGIRADDRLLAVTTPAFDIAALELYLPLLVGAEVVIASRETTADGQLLLAMLTSADISLMQATPATWRMLLLAGWESTPNLKMLCGGEALPVELAAELLARGQALWNVYGPTETTVWSSTLEVRPESLEQGVSIGVPIANTCFYVLDQTNQPLPIGVPGELCIAGAGLARGYRHRPDLTAERFVELPLDGKRQRVYRTGDLARWRADGQVECLGRIDHQVKVRGFRIELGEIEAVLLSHAAVREAAVLLNTTAEGDAQLHAYLIPAEQHNPVGSGAAEVQQWQQIWDAAYADSAADNDPTFNTSGWHSSYDGLPIPPADMREWLDATVQRILQQQPQQVLELGCGTGMLLSWIAPHCTHYVGSDISAEALSVIRRYLQGQDYAARVSLRQAAADDFAGLAEGTFDTVILNSVSQYFPSVDYLLSVLTLAVKALRPGGQIFVGDVRNGQWLEAFHTAIQLHQAKPDSSLADVQAQIARSLREERELLLDPGFFQALPQVIPAIGTVQVQLKRGNALNEMTRFRYDVVLKLAEAEPASVTQWWDWETAAVSLERVQQYLNCQPADIWGIRHVPNARVLEALRQVNFLATAADTATKASLQAWLDSQPHDGVNPEVWYTLAEQSGWQVLISTSTVERSGYYDVVWLPSGKQHVCLATRELPSLRPWSAYANTPFRDVSPAVAAALIPQVRDFIAQRLPDYMLPQRFSLLERFPLTPNGKLDRKALQTLTGVESSAAEVYLPPRTPTEMLLAGLWESLLGLPRVGANDQFFTLGGHSLLATQLVSRIRGQFGVDVPLRQVFERPVLRELAAWLDTRKRGCALPLMQPQAVDAPLFLSFAQQRLWFLSQLEGQTATYNMPATLVLQGQLDKEALQAAGIQLVARHQSLRSCFPAVQGQPVLTLLETYNPLSELDIQHLPTAERLKVLATHAQAHASQPFELARGALLRLCLVRLAEQEHVLLFNMHHIISDGWSLGILVREWVALYNALHQGQSADLPLLAIQYTDYAAWQREWLVSADRQAQLDYWSKQLAGIPKRLQLPTDFAPPAVQDYQGAHLHTVISPVVAEGLKALGKAEGTTLFMTLLATFNVLLAKYSRQDDICVGSPVANRTSQQTEHLLGLFVNTLVFRTRLDKTQRFVDLLQQVRQASLDAYAHQELPFEHLVEKLNPRRSLSHSPLFQVMFVLQNTQEAAFRLPGLTITQQVQDTPIAKFDLTLNVRETATGLACIWEYATGLFTADTMQCMADRFVVLLESIIQQADKPLWQLPCLSQTDQQVLSAWNQTHVTYPAGQTVVDLFATQVAKTPQQPAVVYGDQVLDYAVLNARANQLAHTLLTRYKLGRGARIGICLERSPEMLVGILGTLKAGAAYVPLDPHYPLERIRFMLEDAALPLILTTQTLQATLLADVACLTLALDTDAAFLDQPQTELTFIPDVADLAYVIYTSGSTGLPKGVCVPHRGLYNYVQWASHFYQVAEGCGAPVQSSLNFDATITSLLLPLLNGGQCVLIPERQELESLAAALLKHDNFSLVKITPSHLEVLNQQLTPEQMAGCTRALVIGGEALQARQIQPWQHHAPMTRLINEYGPTEATVGCCIYEASHEVLSTGEVLIGKPIANVRLYVVDEYLQVLPPGIPGELCIAGAGLADAYLNRPELTAEKFVELAWLDKTERVYRTGDLARWLLDGNLQYLGRTDHQVKLRGFRIELGEIEAVLAQHEAVREAAVILMGIPPDVQLVAYVSVKAGLDASAITLRSFLKQRLPDYMLPSLIQVVEQLPLTPNGKIDRQALAALTSVDADVSTPRRLPQTATEQVLAEIWLQLLPRPVIYAEDDFFASGGHSLLVIQLLAQIHAHLKLQLSVRTLFEYPVLQDLATYLDARLMAEHPNHPPSEPLLEGAEEFEL